MAKRKINKSAAIREFLAANPDATPSVIMEGLAKKKIKVSAALVSAVKYNKATKPADGRRKKMGRPARASANGHGVDIDMLVTAKTLSERLGGIEKAKQALDMLAKLS